MNVKTVFNNTLHRGYWGVVTLYHMSYRLLIGLLIFFYPHQFVKTLVQAGVFTSLDESTETLLQQTIRVAALNIAVVGMLFGLFGSVRDTKARQRLTIFSVISSISTLIVYAFFIAKHKTLFMETPLAFGMALEVIGLVLCLANVLAMQWDPTTLYEPKDDRAKGD